MNPLFWDLPETFLLETFLQGSGRHAYQYLSFPAGQRNCAADKCIHTVIKTVIITFVERVKIQIVNKVCDDDQKKFCSDVFNLGATNPCLSSFCVNS
jgi:cytochrome P450